MPKCNVPYALQPVRQRLTNIRNRKMHYTVLFQLHFTCFSPNTH